MEELRGETSPLRIVLVDDHVGFRSGFRELVDSEPRMEVVAEAGNAEEAIEAVHRLYPYGLDLVLMDVNLPGRDGIEVTAELTAEFPELAIVMLTVSTLDRDLFESIRAGAIGFMSKTMAPGPLIRTLDRFHRDRSLPLSAPMARKVLAYFRTGAAEQRASSAALESLTAREQEVLELIADGQKDEAIAESLVLSIGTVKKHVQNILRKLQARNRAEAASHLGRGQ